MFYNRKNSSYDGAFSKKFKAIALATLALSGSAFMTSCGDDDEDLTPVATADPIVVDGDTIETPDVPTLPRTAEEEAALILSFGASEANRTEADFSGSDRGFTAEENVFLPSAISVNDLEDNETANTIIPLYRGIGPSGQDTYFIITETSTQATAETLGAILSPKLAFGALPSAADAAQRVELTDEGQIIFRGDVDFSPERVLEGTGFPPTVNQPGAVGDAEYSSLVVLPSGLVINAQIVGNSTGLHDRIIEANTDERWARFQLLDGWENGERYYYHLVTDASDPVPATIELGVYAPRMANLPNFGEGRLTDTELSLIHI